MEEEFPAFVQNQKCY